MRSCTYELCPNWSGDGAFCPCAALGLTPGELPGVRPVSSVTVWFVGGPWDAKTTDVPRVVGPMYAVGDIIGKHYWLDVKSDPPTYHWDNSESL